MKDKKPEEIRTNSTLPEDDLFDDDMYYDEEPDEVDTNRIRRVEFRKGILCGLLIAGICILGFLLFSFGTFGSRKAEGTSVLTSVRTRRKIRETKKLIDEKFLYSVDADDMETYLFMGIMAGLDDPYAAYYSAKDMEEIDKSNAGQYKGIGITIGQDEAGTYPVILSVYPDSPAEKAGVMKGDLIIKINGEDVAGKTYIEAADMITSDLESVSLVVQRGEEEKEFVMEQGMIATAPVTFEMLEDDTGYICIPEFDTVTVEQFENAVTELTDQGMQRMVIDVRDNPGGLLDSVCAILDDLLPECLLVYTEDKNGNGNKFYSDENQITQVPLAVLVNGNSASASEVFAGAMQDYDAAVIIGQKTFGKGIVQRTYTYDDGSAFKLTTEKYLTGGGQDIHGQGIEPDIVVEEEDEQLSRAIKELKD
ncbi:MAG: PDZ domain-containing protein [Lachnospiraceae bacterium]|nr:PDZ domain-containing protein [Lachnospiraceae bacterium]